jgi:hypothetical protein
MEGSVEGPLAMAPLPGPRVSWEGPWRGQWRDRLPWHRSQGLESPGRDHGGVLLVCGCVVLGVHAHRRFHVLPSWSDELLLGGLLGTPLRWGLFRPSGPLPPTIASARTCADTS